MASALFWDVTHYLSTLRKISEVRKFQFFYVTLFQNFTCTSNFFECRMHVDFSLTVIKILTVTYKKVAYNKRTDTKNYKYRKVSYLWCICDIFNIIGIDTVDYHT